MSRVTANVLKQKIKLIKKILCFIGVHQTIFAGVSCDFFVIKYCVNCQNVFTKGGKSQFGENTVFYIGDNIDD